MVIDTFSDVYVSHILVSVQYHISPALCHPVQLKEVVSVAVFVFLQGLIYANYPYETHNGY